MEYLEDTWGTLPIKTISRKLGRSCESISAQVRKMGLGRFTENSEWLPMNIVLETLYGRTVGGEELKRVLKMGIPFHEKTYGKKQRVVRAVFLPELWPWLYENRRKINLANFEENIFGEEPAWVKEKRRIDVDEALNGTQEIHELRKEVDNI